MRRSAEAPPPRFAELVDVGALRGLCESFTAMTGAVTAVLELDGEILVATGWQDICTRFHRIHPVTAEQCRESDTALAGRLRQGETYTIYECRNGLVDVAVPIKVGGEHVANLFTGQFFFEPPEAGRFTRQARACGFDEAAYLRALERAPVFSREHVRTLMDFLTRLAEVLGEMGLSTLRARKANAELEIAAATIARDVTERRRVEATLRESETRYRALADRLPLAIQIFAPDGSTAWVNRSWERLWHADLAALARYNVLEDRQLAATGVREHLHRAFRGEAVEFPLHRYDKALVEQAPPGGGQLWLRAFAYPVTREDGSLREVVVVQEDVTRRIEDEQRLRDGEAFVVSIMDSLRAHVAVLDETTTIVAVNAAWRRFAAENGVGDGECGVGVGVNYAELCRKACRAPGGEEAMATLDGIEAVLAGTCAEFRLEYPCHSPAKERWFRLNAVPLRGSRHGAVLIHEDITAEKQAGKRQRRLEHQLRESQKMEAIGILAGGIAHDFNNILGAIRGNAELALLDVRDRPDDALQSLAEIQKGANRARDLVQQILTFSRKERHELVPRALQPVIEDSARLLRSTLPAGVELRLALAQAPLVVPCDFTQVQQVVLNLCTNAWHAMDHGKGLIEIEAAPAWLDPAGAAELPPLAPGWHARLAVSDDGRGMDARTRAHAFEPFFTSKPPGQGTGLGLSVVHGIVSSHGGAIRLSSAPRRGSLFEVFLPLVDAPPPAGSGR